MHWVYAGDVKRVLGCGVLWAWELGYEFAYASYVSLGWWGRVLQRLAGPGLNYSRIGGPGTSTTSPLLYSTSLSVIKFRTAKYN